MSGEHSVPDRRDAGYSITDMHLIEILLPVRDNHGRPFPETKFTAIREALTNRFGGAT
jgi:hypothetical protein